MSSIICSNCQRAIDKTEYIDDGGNGMCEHCAPKPKIFIFCNSCSHEWHSASALSEDGHFLAGHVCSDHGFIPHDMGMTSDWKHDDYNKHYPDGWELEYVERSEVKSHPGITAAYEKHIARGKPEPKEAA
tara:strand:- start:49 stop:438 length:390 start_codon:yes stop_codon:yes gene_type:complete